MHAKFRQIYIGLVALLLVGLLLGLQSASLAQAQSITPQWQDTGITSENNFCLDSGRKERLVYSRLSGDVNSGEPAGSAWVLDLQTGQTKVLTNRSLSYAECGPKGSFYIQDVNAVKGTYLINTVDQTEKKIEYLPNFRAVDGSNYAYYYREHNRNGEQKSLLVASADGGLSWQERGQQFNGFIRSFSMSQSDARVVYVLVQAANPQADGKTAFSIYVSRNAGESWELRYQSADIEDFARGGVPYSVNSLSGYQTPADIVAITKMSGGFGSSSRATVFISVDGARNFNEIGTSSIVTSVSIHFSGNGLTRIMSSTESGNRVTKFEFSVNGKDWSPLNLPTEISTGQNFALFQTIPTSANNILISRQDLKKIWLSTNGGKNWQLISDGFAYEWFKISPYAPTTLIARGNNNRMFKLDLSQYDKTQTERARANNLSADNIYFPETGHNLNGVFRRYWEANGGLAQFGYPKTEPFPEFNPADGKIYVAQYFERNRFEYHPELAGTKYEVLLGLLGNQMTEKQRAEGHGAFNRFANMNYPGGTYFPETGHNLRNSFKAYWEQYGGLAIYGYPTSEEYEEVNPDDGKTYVVQYFERARFEYHPENKGTKYEVLLGLLGNALLRQKAWLS